jgi:5'-AMP-activated protein kinase catalytic alpha subunit
VIGQIYVVKALKNGVMFNEEENNIEAGLLLRLNHPNIIKMYEYRNYGKIVLTTGAEMDCVYFVLEHADIGTIYDLVQNCGALNEKLARFYFSKLIDSVGFLHTLGIAHRDIKPLNILLKSDDHMLKLADFGHAVDLRTLKDGFCKGSKGTHDYRAPEAYSKYGYDPMPADVFSCGVTLFSIVFGFELFFKKKG